MERISPALYTEVKNWLLANDPDGQPMLEWACRDLHRPDTPENLASEIIWIILCAGRRAQAARTIERKVWNAINHNQPVVEVFRYKKKAEAIERAWHERQNDFAALCTIPVNDVESLVDWCNSIPFVGNDTKYQLAKNFGANVCKPDIWLCRLAGIPDYPRQPVKERFRACLALCQSLADKTGDSVAVIDSILWLACNKGVLSVSQEAGSIQFSPSSIYTSQPIMPDARVESDK